MVNEPLLKQAGPQESMGLVEITGPLEVCTGVDGASGQELMSPLERAGALEQEPMESPCRPWGPLRLEGAQINSQWRAFGGHCAPLETTGPSWRLLGLLELAWALD